MEPYCWLRVWCFYCPVIEETPNYPVLNSQTVSTDGPHWAVDENPRVQFCNSLPVLTPTEENDGDLILVFKKYQ